MLSIDFHTKLDKEQLSLLTQQPMRDLVNDECVITDGSMLCSLPSFWYIQLVSRFANVGLFSFDQVMIMAALCNRAGHYIFAL